jgi:hypothetical protein
LYTFQAQDLFGQFLFLDILVAIEIGQAPCGRSQVEGNVLTVGHLQPSFRLGHRGRIWLQWNWRFDQFEAGSYKPHGRSTRPVQQRFFETDNRESVPPSV